MIRKIPLSFSLVFPREIAKDDVILCADALIHSDELLLSPHLEPIFKSLPNQLKDVVDFISWGQMDGHNFAKALGWEQQIFDDVLSKLQVLAGTDKLPNITRPPSGVPHRPIKK